MNIAEKKYNNPATKEVMHYKDALWFGFQEIDKRPFLTTNLFIKLVQIIKENTVPLAGFSSLFLCIVLMKDCFLTFQKLTLF